MERDPLVRGLLLMLAAIGFVWLAGWVWQIVSQFADVLLLFFLAWLLAFVLNPLVRRLGRIGIPRLAGVALVYVLLALILLTMGLLMVPALVSQTVQLATSLPALADNLQQRADELHLSLVQRGLPEAQLQEVYRNAISRAETVGTTALSSSLTIATSILGGFLRASLVLILSFYIMLDGDKIARLFVALMPVRYREGIANALEQIDRTFGGFVRGQLVQAVVYATGTWVVMQIAGLPYSLVLSIFAGVAMAIPFIGPYLAMGPIIILAVILAPGTVWWVFILLFILQFIVVNVLAPRIMSQSVGIHPLLVFAAVLIGAQVAGGWGAIFGVPVAAMVFLLLRVFYQRVVLSLPLYRSGARLSVEAIAPVKSPPEGQVAG
ncbi:MAG TPA: AI-2E family transporter [Chloroflexota bacterium]|nr:AI-2E family transporter [Chloroflexota bacterium]